MTHPMYRFLATPYRVRLVHVCTRESEQGHSPVEQVTYLLNEPPEFMDRLTGRVLIARAILQHATASGILTTVWATAFATEKLIAMKDEWEITTDEVEKWLTGKLAGKVPLKEHPNPITGRQQ